MMTITWIRLSFFLLFSTVLLVFTLRRSHAHRGYRFVAFECILALIFLQADVWFSMPLRIAQIISWAALAGSLLLALHGFRILSTIGAPEQDIENTTTLVTTGAYRYIRHPLYASLLLFGIGAFLKQISLLSGFLTLTLFSAVYMTARIEERSNQDRFGEDYDDYMKRSKMFIPFLF
jgi:protein-S-isoprenylcysteine O-methyltransferase Ste14